MDSCVMLVAGARVKVLPVARSGSEISFFFKVAGEEYLPKLWQLRYL